MRARGFQRGILFSGVGLSVTLAGGAQGLSKVNTLLQNVLTLLQGVSAVIVAIAVIVVGYKTTCLVTRPIRSDSGRVVLIDRGSLVTGEYRSSAVLGEDRLMVLWRRLKNPDGVVINLESPATDPLGTAGVSGELDAHWRDRIGAAFLLSVIQDGIAYAANSRQSDAGTTTVVLPNTTQTGGQMANKVLESTIGIAPTLTKMQGERVAILVARDLRFESQYRDAPDYLGR